MCKEITYECTPAFGWGCFGVHRSGIDRELRLLGLKNECPPVWPKLCEVIIAYPIKVTGEAAKVDAFKNYMKMKGYDDRKD